MRQIIVLDTNPGDNGQLSIKVVFWYAIAAGHEYPKPTFQSAIDATLAAKNNQVAVQPAELTALQNGTVLEEVLLKSFPKSYTPAQIKAELQVCWSDKNAYIQALANPIAYYGVSFDSVNGWSA